MKKLFLIFLLVLSYSIHGYSLPYISLGLSSFLDGGPLRPSPGFYWIQYGQYYTTHKFLDAWGKLLNGVRSPRFKSWYAISLFIYQFDTKIMGAQPGMDIAFPFALSPHISKPNALDIDRAIGGLGDIGMGIYLQWDPIFYNKRPLFVHRLELFISAPTGTKINSPTVISPGNGFYYINPYWSGTLFITPNFSCSWRLHYLWSARNPLNNLQAGDAVYINYGIGWGTEDVYCIGLNGYYLAQLRDDKQDGIKIAHSRERIVAFGPGGVYYFSPEDILLANLYIETMARNRTQGINFVLKFVKQF
jgi:hypothetical protein